MTLQERAEQVFDLDDDEFVVSVEGENDCVRMRMFNENTCMEWYYLPDMTDRPQALAFLKGERDDFND